MGLTGLFLISFLVVHVSINSCIYFNDGGETFNAAANFMAHNPVIRIVEIGLFGGLILHCIQALILTLQNRKARPVAYAKTDGAANSKWYSRSMGVLGSLLLLFYGTKYVASVTTLGTTTATTLGEVLITSQGIATGANGTVTLKPCGNGTATTFATCTAPVLSGTIAGWQCGPGRTGTPVLSKFLPGSCRSV